MEEGRRTKTHNRPEDEARPRGVEMQVGLWQLHLAIPAMVQIISA